ncbi:beta/gamma crystallin-related protein [Aquabacterium sp.]|uniref:beta/gamma crystallin-related protein n=1 Tax=Aquabacterium sp. TaxID=1872578 RepID=UPI003782E707
MTSPKFLPTRRLVRAALAVAAALAAAQAGAQVTFYEHDGFQGRAYSTDHRIGNLARVGFNDLASSVVVSSDRWEVCEDAGFSGRCRVLRPGSYPSLRAIGLNDRLSSVRRLERDEYVADARYAPLPPPVREDFHRRHNERLYQAEVTSVRAVLAQPERRCWVEREQVGSVRSDTVGAGIAGAVIGGILGHQVGGGTGRDLATVGGAVAGAALGSRIARDAQGQPVVQDVRRCESVPAQARPEYWDVTYRFRGIEHHVQMTVPPGPTLIVNRDGEPRVA